MEGEYWMRILSSLVSLSRLSTSENYAMYVILSYFPPQQQKVNKNKHKYKSKTVA